VSPLEDAPDAPPEDDRHLSGRDSGTATMMKNTSRMAMAVAAAITRSSLQSGFHHYIFQSTYSITTSVADLDLDPLVRNTDPHVSGTPGFGSPSQRYESGSGSGFFPFLIKVLSRRK
jgi:hypothetical protein